MCLLTLFYSSYLTKILRGKYVPPLQLLNQKRHKKTGFKLMTTSEPNFQKNHVIFAQAFIAVSIFVLNFVF